MRIGHATRAGRSPRRRGWVTGALAAVLAVCASASALGAPTGGASAEAAREEALVAFESGRAIIVRREERLADICASPCSGPVLRKAIADLRALDRATLPALDAAIARLRAGRDVTDRQRNALLSFGRREPVLLERVRAALRLRPATLGDGAAAESAAYAWGRFLGGILFYVGIPVGAFLLIRRRIRARRLAA